MDEVFEVDVVYDVKKGKLTFSGLDSSLVQEIMKKLARKKKVAVQVFPDGIVITQEGIYWSHAVQNRDSSIYA